METPTMFQQSADFAKSLKDMYEELLARASEASRNFHTLIDENPYNVLDISQACINARTAYNILTHSQQESTPFSSSSAALAFSSIPKDDYLAKLSNISNEQIMKGLIEALFVRDAKTITGPQYSVFSDLQQYRFIEVYPEGTTPNLYKLGEIGIRIFRFLIKHHPLVDYLLNIIEDPATCDDVPAATKLILKLMFPDKDSDPRTIIETISLLARVRPCVHSTILRNLALDQAMTIPGYRALMTLLDNDVEWTQANVEVFNRSLLVSPRELFSTKSTDQDSTLMELFRLVSADGLWHKLIRKNIWVKGALTPVMFSEDEV